MGAERTNGMSGTHDGETAIVTGSSSGIGRAIAHELAAEGANVVTNARSQSRAASTADEIEKRGGNAIAVEADVSEYDAVEELVDAAVAEYGRLDVMVNNAAIQRRGDTESMALSDWHDVIDVNLHGVYYGARAAGARMIEQGDGGRILNISSIMGSQGQADPGRTPYNTAKGAVNNLTRCLAVEWGEAGILVNALAPGYIKTEHTEESLADAPFSAEGVTGRVPLRRWGTPEEMARCASFLTRDDHFVTGEVLTADGGWLASGWGDHGE